ncbi:MAG: LytR C-terminal domain-containing protein, partial [Micrococcales bacterium]|nr:LytR C-terminal domain-containing protein [Micrococcales bacterium]
MAHDNGYVHQAGRTSAQRRRRRAAVTMALVFVLLLSAFGIAVAFNQGWVGDRSPASDPASACVPYSEPPPPQDITVNVYNSTTKKGLALTASQALAGQQFRIQTVSNDPLRKQVT